MSDEQVDDTNVEQEAIEHRARMQGWRPEEEYRGKPGTWVDADTFLERGKEIKNFTKRENEQLRRELAELRTALEEKGKTIEEIREYHANMERRAIEAAITRLKRERTQAAAAGDTALAAELSDEIEELKEAPSAVPAKPAAETPATPAKPVEPPEVTAWKAEQAGWYNDDPENEDLVAFAEGVAQKLASTRGTLEEKLELLTERVKKAFPDRFGSRKRVAATMGTGEGGGREGSRKSAKSVSALPAEAAQAGARYVKQGLYKNMEEYAAEYWAQPGAR
jgi:DNA repair exonuclease SbcCD ATPase subunit